MMEINRKKKVVCVRYIGDSDVSNIFNGLDVEKVQVGSQNLRKRRKVEKVVEQELQVPDSAVQTKPSNLFENGDVAGQLIFGFQTPKHRHAMINKASESASRTPQTPSQKKEAKTPGRGTPLSQRGKSKASVVASALDQAVSKRVATPVQCSPSQKVLLQSKNYNTPKAAKKLCYSNNEDGKENTICPQIPYNLRRKIKKKLATIASEELCYSDESEADFSGSESDWDSRSDATSADSSSDNEESHEVQKVVLSKKGFGPSLSKNLKLNFIPAAEEYFQSHASKKILTSNHTLGKLRHNLPQEKLQTLLSEAISSHSTQLEKLHKSVTSLFTKWQFVLREGFSILLYGVGSKHKLLSSFHQQLPEPSVVVNGFFPSLTIQEIVSSIAEDILGLNGISVDLLETVDCIKSAFSQRHSARLFLVVHNIDGVMLRNDKNQEVLANLASTPNIHLIASIDHISAPLMWDQNMLSMFNFSWWDATSFQPYVNETAFESSLLVQQSGNLALSSLQNVFRSLTNNAKSIFLLMAEYQKEHKDESHYSGMPFKKLYTMCRESLLVSSDLALRSQLTEFLDHRLVKSRRGHDGSELLTIPMDKTILDQFVSEQTVS